MFASTKIWSNSLPAALATDLHPVAFHYLSTKLEAKSISGPLSFSLFFFFFLGSCKLDDTTMAGVNDTRLYLTRSSLWKPESIEVFGVWKTGDDICSRKREVRSLCVRGSSSYQSVDRINGNVTGINGTAAPSVGKSNGWKNEKSGPTHNSMLGRFVEDRFVFRQTFVIRSYEIGPDKTATMETIMNLLQVCVHSPHFDSLLSMTL